MFLRRHAALLVVLALVALYAVEAHARRRAFPTPATLGDQGAYLAYARQMRESGYEVLGDRNRMPIYPFLLSLIYRPGMDETEFLRAAQSFNVNLSIVLLLLLFVILRRLMPAVLAVALVAATAFGVFLYRAVNAQVEVLFYFVGFCTFLLFLRMLTAPRWWLAALCGLAFGVAHLTKASLLPTLSLWALVFAAQSFYLRGLWRRLGMLLVVFAAFIAVVFPYIRNSKRIYGSYFFNVNSSFVMWCDSSTQGWRFVEDWAYQARWRSLPPEQVPSAANYWRQHSFKQIALRLVRGLRQLATQNAMAIGYYKFVALLVLALAVVIIRRSREAWRFLVEKPFTSAFCVLFIASYLGLFAWYSAISTDSRFLLTIFLPFVFAGSVFVLRTAPEWVVELGSRRMAFVQLFAFTFGGLSVIDASYNAFRVVAHG